MPEKVYTFGSFALIPANGIYVSEDNNMSPAMRKLSILGQAGYRGEKALRSIDASKVIVLKGTIYKETKEEFIDAIDAFNKAIMNEGSVNLPSDVLKVENSEGTYVYEGAIAIATEAMIPPEQPYNINWIPFQVTFFIPKGFARSITQTQVLFANLTTTPKTNTIVIESDANPEPIIILRFTTHTTITAFNILNSTVNESISCSGLTIVDGDVVIIDTAEKTVMQNANLIRYSGVMPRFIVGANEIVTSFTGTANAVAEQRNFDGARNVYGDNWVSQKFQVGGSPVNVSQIGLTLKRVSQETDLVPYANFDDNTIDPTKISTTGRVSASGGRMILVARDSGGNETDATFTTDNLDGDPIYGYALNMHWEGNRGNDDGMYTELSDGTNKIRFKMTHTPDKVHLELFGSYGSGEVAVWDGEGDVEIRPNGSTIEIYGGGILRYTLNDTIEPNSVLNGSAAANGGGDEAIALWIDNISVYEAVLTNSDLTIRIETDTAGSPSGSIVTNGSLTIPASLVGTDGFSEIIKAFASAVALSATTDYHLVIKQTGGDINNYYQVKVNSTAGYASGNSETTSNAGASWTQHTGEDLFFGVYGPLPTGFTVGLEIDYYPSKYSIV